jgi:hypothetical protein
MPTSKNAVLETTVFDSQVGLLADDTAQFGRRVQSHLYRATTHNTHRIKTRTRDEVAPRGRFIQLSLTSWSECRFNAISCGSRSSVQAGTDDLDIEHPTALLASTAIISSTRKGMKVTAQLGLHLQVLQHSLLHSPRLSLYIPLGGDSDLGVLGP